MRSDHRRKQHWGPSHSKASEESDFAGMHIDWLIDNCEAYWATLAAIRGARESIRISQLAFDSDCIAYSAGDSGSDADRRGENLIDVILAASTEKGVRVKILLNSTLLLDTKRPLLRYLARQEISPGLVQVRGISRFPQLLHAKMVIVDERRAFIVGSPFVNGYWDTSAHRALDNRRPHRELAGRPVHDVSVGVSGPIVRDLAETFERYWQSADRGQSGSVAPAAPKPIEHAGAGITAAVVRTEPTAGRGSKDSGSMEIRTALLEGIGRARSLIYIEHQYLSARSVVDAIRGALARVPELEVILLLNQNPDVTAYRRWQNTRLAEMGLLAHPRVGVFALWTGQQHNGPQTAINQVFLHSKVVIVDDEWAMVGSANLDGVSLDSYGDDFSGRVARRVFRDVRNFDVSVVLKARKSARAKNPVRDLRERLWKEHLGHVSKQAMDSEYGQVAGWNTAASRNVAALNDIAHGRDAGLEGSFILPYSTSPNPRAQLADAGVLPATRFDLKFDPGWLEVNFSPNWIRNMFL